MAAVLHPPSIPITRVAGKHALEAPKYNRYWVPRARPAAHGAETSFDASQIWQPGPGEYDQVPRPTLYGLRRLKRKYSKFYRKSELEDGTLFFRFPPILDFMSLSQHKTARERKEIPFEKLPFRADYRALSTSEMEEARALMTENPLKWDIISVASKFRTSPEFVHHIRTALPFPLNRVRDLRFETQLRYWRDIRDRQLADAFPSNPTQAAADYDAADLRNRITPFNWMDSKPFSLEPTPVNRHSADPYRAMAENIPDYDREATLMRGVDMLRQLTASQREEGTVAENADAVAGTATGGALAPADAAEWRRRQRLSDSFDYVAGHVEYMAPWLTPKYRYSATQGRVMFRNPLREAFAHQQTTGRPLYYHDKTL